MRENTAQGNENVRRRADCGGKPVKADAETFRLMKKPAAGRHGLPVGWRPAGRDRAAGRRADQSTAFCCCTAVSWGLRGIWRVSARKKREKENPSLFFIRLW